MGFNYNNISPINSVLKEKIFLDLKMYSWSFDEDYYGHYLNNYYNTGKDLRPLRELIVNNRITRKLPITERGFDNKEW